MKNRLLAAFFLSCLSFSFATSSQAGINTRQSQQEFQETLCRQNWREALELTTELMASPEVSLEYKNYLEAFQPMLLDYQQRAVWIANEPWCYSGSGDYHRIDQGIGTLHPYWSGHVGNGEQTAPETPIEQ